MKKINIKTIRKRYENLFDKTYNTIVEVMKKRGVKAISFINNGDNVCFAVDPAYTTMEADSFVDCSIISKEIVLIMVEDNTINIATEDNMSGENISLLEENDVYSPKAWDEMETNKSIDFKLLDETYTPNETMLDLAITVNEVLEGCMGGKSLKDGQMIRFE